MRSVDRPERWRAADGRSVSLPRRFALLLVLFFLFHATISAQVRETRRALIFYENGPAFPAIALIDQRIRTAMGNSPYQIDYYREYLQTALFPDPVVQQEFREWYAHKYRDNKPDIIITVGPSPLRFLVDSHVAFFRDIPIVFCAADEQEVGRPKLAANFTGVWEELEPAKTLDAALRLEPGARHVVVVGGSGQRDRELEGLVKQRLQSYQAKLELTYLTDLPMPELLDRVHHLPNDTVVLLISITRDATGRQFIPATESGPLIVQAANAPVFTLNDVNLGHGEEGGYVNSFADEGDAAGAIAVRILRGDRPQDIPIVRGTNAYMFDAVALKHWGLNERALPAGSVVINRPPSFWRAYRRYVIAGIFVLFAQSLAILALLWQRAKRRKMEVELMRSSERLRIAMESGKSVGWEWDLTSGQNVWFGDLPTIFGVPSETFRGQIEDFYRYVHPEDRQRVSQGVAEAREKRTPYLGEFRAVRTDGVTRWLVSRGRFEYGRNGKAKRMLGMAVDITDVKHAEQALRDSEERFRLAAQAGKMYAYEWDVTTDVLERSPEYVKILGLTEPMRFTRQQFVEKIHPEDRAKFLATIGDLNPQNAIREVTYRVLLPGGTVVWLKNSGRAFFDGEGRMLRVIGMVADVTDQKLAEEALRSSEEKFARAFHESPLAVTVASLRDHRYLELNETFEQLTGRSRAELIGQTPLGIWVDPADREDLLKRLQAEGTVRNLEVRIRRKDGEIRSVLGSAELIEIDGEPCVLSVISDVTERRRAEEARRASEERSREFVRRSPIAMAVTEGAEQRVLMTNDRFTELFGYTLEDVPDVAHWWSLAYPDPLYREEVKAEWEAHLETALKNRTEIVPMEATVRCKNGASRYIEFHLSPFGDASVVSFVDLTDRKQFEESLVWRLQWERLISDLSTTFINLAEDEVAPNMERSMARVGAFLKMDRVTLFEISRGGQELMTICSWNALGIPAPPTVVSTTDLPWWRNQLLRGDASLASDPEALPAEASAEKEYFKQQGIVSAVSIPLKMGGEVNGAISFVTAKRRVNWTEDLVSQLRVIGEIFWNALERRRVMQALVASQAVLSESEQRFRLVANTAPVMIWMSDTSKLCRYFNQPWLQFTGRSLQEELGNGWMEGVHPEDRENCIKVYITAFDRREPFEMEYRLRRHDGEYRWIFDQGVPRFNVDKSFAGYIGSAIDVTVRKLAEEALSSLGRKLIEAQEQERMRIARELHDDINQRIALLATNLEHLKQNLPVTAAEIKKRLNEGCQLLADLGSDIQALSHRLHSSKLEYLGIAAAASSFCKEISDKHRVQIDFHSEGVPKQLPRETALCLFRILQEAVQNFAKHSGSRHCEVGLKGMPDEVTLTVRDAGIGFDPDEAMKGRGLGLTSMKERVKLVDGELFIDSGPRRGTVIRAVVPLGPAIKAVSA